MIPEIPGCELAVRFSPATAGDLVGGDFYDVFAVDPDRWAVVVGDVCGKGAEAAAVTATVRWTLRSLADAADAPGDALQRLNDAMLRHDLGNRFITIAYARVTVGPRAARSSWPAPGTRRPCCCRRPASPPRCPRSATCSACGGRSGCTRRRSRWARTPPWSSTPTASPSRGRARSARSSRRCATSRRARAPPASRASSSARLIAGVSTRATTSRSWHCGSKAAPAAEGASPARARAPLQALRLGRRPLAGSGSRASRARGRVLGTRKAVARHALRNAVAITKVSVKPVTVG
jgi:hypothetical protein